MGSEDHQLEHKIINDFLLFLSFFRIAFHALFADFIAIITNVFDAVFAGNHHASWQYEYGKQRGNGKQTGSTVDKAAASEERR